MPIRMRHLWACTGLGLILWTGCAVPQPRGDGVYRFVQEPTTKAWYHLYLPVDYIRNQGRHPDPKMKRWPLVMTFHGMKPYDNARPQELEWEKEADVYGYIVCAPQLATSDSFMEYPLTKEHDYVLRDKRNVMAIMDHLFATTFADPGRVLSTSWSCGGYLAHYFPNRFPHRFSCIATRLSNFSYRLMKEETVPLYRDKVPVAIFIGDGDFPACKTESETAVAWYLSRKFRVVRGKMIDRMGHRRIPQVAAAFFAEQLGIEPLRPLEAAKTVAQVQMTDYSPPQDLIAKMAPRVPVVGRGPVLARGGSGPDLAVLPALPQVAPARAVVYQSTTAGRNYPIDRTPSYDAAPESDHGRTGGRGRATTPPTAASATRVATVARSRSNWLAPTGAPLRQAAAGRPAAPSGHEADGAAVRAGDAVARGTEPDRPGSGSPGSKPGDRARPTGGSLPGKAALAAPLRRFNPEDAGPKDYEQLLAKANPNGRRRAADRSRRPPAQGSRSGRVSSPSAAPPPSPLSSTVKRVNIRLSGPAIGTAPHYIAFGVDLPRDVLEGADCLWMDNGVWISDEPRGVKVLESPGLHRITALIVTKADVEYRGSATVQVLEPGPASPARRQESQ